VKGQGDLISPIGVLAQLPDSAASRCGCVLRRAYDRRMKTTHPISLALALLIAACAGAVVRPIFIPPASAEPGRQCDWRYLIDQSAPNIPEESSTEPMSPEWMAMGKAGYRVVASQDAFYLFERCVGQ